MGQFTDRTELMIGSLGVERLRDSAVLVFGAGGVGGAALEGLARAGIGRIGICEFDQVDVTNINRQLLATHDNVGEEKSKVAMQRLRAINPHLLLEEYPFFYGAETCEQIDLKRYNFIIDAIDSVGAKLLLAERAKEAGVPLIASMGTGNKLNPALFQIVDIQKTSVCPLARVMRRELKKRGIGRLTVLYSTEQPIAIERREGVKAGSISFVPTVAGLLLAGHVVRELLPKKEESVHHEY